MATILATVCNVIELVKLVQKLAKEYVHTVEGARKVLIPEIGRLASLKGVLEGIQSQVECDESESSRISSLAFIDGPLAACDKALQLLKKRLEKPPHSLGGFTLGKLMDGKTKRALKSLEDTKQILELALTADNMTLNKAVEDYIKAVARDVLSLRESVDDHRHETSDGFTNIERPAIVNWLSPLNFTETQVDVFGRHQEGTCSWVLESDQFKDWLASPGTTLWCPGIPGAGKTVLVSIIAEYLKDQHRSQDDVGVACVYCNFGDQSTQTPINLIAGIWRQLAQRQNSLPEYVKELYTSHHRPTLVEIAKILRSEINRHSKVFVLVDALDECSEENGHRKNFHAELQALPSNVHILVTSRDLDTIARWNKDSKKLEIKARTEDIQAYVQRRILEEDRLLHHTQKDPNLEEAIVKGVIKICEEMFLLAKLHMDSLAAKRTPTAVRVALKSLPQRLYDTYDQIMERIESQTEDGKQLAMRILSWIAYAERPLTVQELQHALSVAPEQSNFDEYNIPEEEYLTSVCAGLVIIDKNSNTVRLVHATAQEYFQHVREKRFPDAQIEITRTCLSYLSFDDFASGYLRFDNYTIGFYDKKRKIEMRLQKYPFLAYAAQYWGCHARGDPEQRLMNAVLRFLAQSSKVSCSIQVMYSQEQRVRSWNECLELVPGLWVAATFGLGKIVEILAGQGAKVNALSCGYTALHQAARRGYEDTVRLLVRKKADVNTRGRDGQTPLQLAAAEGHENVVRLLLENGANITVRDEYGDTTLAAAIRGGNVKVVQMMVVEHGVDTECVDVYGGTAMHAAARTGSEEIVRYLLKVSPHLVSARDNNGCIPLSLAVFNENLPVARLLLESNPRIVNMADNSGMTALQLAARGKNEELVKLLIGKRADIMARSMSGLTALHKAAFYGCEAVIRLLIGHGADIAARDNQGETALHHTAIRQDPGAVQLLLEKGADVAVKDDLGITALHYAASRGCEKTIQLLLEKGADIAATDDQGGTALHDAATRQDPGAVRLLLEKGADIAATDDQGKTVLHYAISWGCGKTIQLLLEKGADIAATDDQGRTALHDAAENGNKEVIQLLEKGADIAATDDQGKTALHSAVKRGHQKTVQFLLEKGADPATINIADLSKDRGVFESNFQAAIRIIESRLEQPGKNNARLPSEQQVDSPP